MSGAEQLGLITNWESAAERGFVEVIATGESLCITSASFAGFRYSSILPHSPFIKLLGRLVLLERGQGNDVFIREFAQLTTANSPLSSRIQGQITTIIGRFAFLSSSEMTLPVVIPTQYFVDHEITQDDVGRRMSFQLSPCSLFVQNAQWHSDPPVETRQRLRPSAKKIDDGTVFVKRECQYEEGLDFHTPGLRPAQLLGTWTCEGLQPSAFFHPSLDIELQWINGSNTGDGVAAEEPFCNNVPPVFFAKRKICINLVASWGVSSCLASLIACDGEDSHHDLTEDLFQTTVLNPRQKSIDLDSSETQVVQAFVMETMEVEELDGITFRLVLRFTAPFGQCKLVSKEAVYRASPPPSSSPTQSCSISKKFWSGDILTPNDRVANGFIDPGRCNQLLSANGYKRIADLDREVLRISKNDLRLSKMVDCAKQTILRIHDTKARAEVLAWYVSSTFGGAAVSENEVEGELKTLRKSVASRKRIRNDPGNDVSQNIVDLGSVKSGLCRHRSLLYKYLCDTCRIPCYYLRGLYGEDQDRHSWNIVVADDRHWLVDVTLNPDCLLPWPHPQYSCPSFVPADTSSFRSIEIDDTKIVCLEECGRGVCGRVLHATIGQLSCALKVPRSREDIPSLRQEYLMLKRFQRNRNIVQVFGWRDAILMELLPMSLLGVMNQLTLRRRGLSLSQLLSVTRGVLRALLSLHDCTPRIVHRDVKAENILVCVMRCHSCIQMGILCSRCALKVKLADFADCVELVNGSEYCDGTRRGTPPYAAPEIEAMKPFSCAADIWSVGILVVEMLNMALPSPNTSNGTHVASPYNPREEIFVPEPLAPPPSPIAKLISQCLQPEWTKRISAAAALELLRSIDE